MRVARALRMQLELSSDEVGFLREALRRDAERLQDEVAHTEAHALQHALKRDIDGVERLRRKLEAASLSAGPVPPAAPAHQ